MYCVSFLGKNTEEDNEFGYILGKLVSKAALARFTLPLQESKIHSPSLAKKCKASS